MCPYRVYKRYMRCFWRSRIRNVQRPRFRGYDAEVLRLSMDSWPLYSAFKENLAWYVLMDGPTKRRSLDHFGSKADTERGTKSKYRGSMYAATKGIRLRAQNTASTRSCFGEPRYLLASSPGMCKVRPPLTYLIAFKSYFTNGCLRCRMHYGYENTIYPSGRKLLL